MINTNELLELFNEIFKTNFPSLDIERNQVPEWDSMKHAELIIKIQKKFNFKFKAKDISYIKNLKEIKMLMEKTITPLS